MLIEKSFYDAHKRMIEKKWDKIYVLIDIHNTIFKPSYHNKETFEWFKEAKETLQLMTKCKEICLILWTSSHEDKIKEYLKVFEENEIHFDYVNENPEVKNDDLGNFDDKLYFNVGIDDKFGFIADRDWRTVYNKVKTDFFNKENKWIETEMCK